MPVARGALRPSACSARRRNLDPSNLTSCNGGVSYAGTSPGGTAPTYHQPLRHMPLRTLTCLFNLAASRKRGVLPRVIPP